MGLRRVLVGGLALFAEHIPTMLVDFLSELSAGWPEL